jgi:hypothetical protein
MREVRAVGWCFAEHSEFPVVLRERLNDTTRPPDRTVLEIKRQIGINRRLHVRSDLLVRILVESRANLK